MDISSSFKGNKIFVWTKDNFDTFFDRTKNLSDIQFHFLFK